ncbi:MAG: helix-turn-helix domain-containing protein [Candidatus Dormibacteraceae bacterium]
MAHLSAGELQALRRSFGERVRFLREHRGLSQERFAEQAGVHRTYVSSVERGQRNIGLDNIHAFANALAVSPARLFEEE